MKLAIALVLGCAASAVLAAEEARKPIDLTLQWHVSLDANGGIVSMKPVDEKNAELYRRLDPEVHAWHFSAGRVDGVAAPAETTLTVNLRLEPTDGGYRVNLRGAGAGGSYATTTAPRYPDGALMSHRGGGVLLRVRYDSEGRVTDAAAVEGGLPKPGNDIERAAVASVKHWTFRPESIAGHPEAGTVMVPICFSAGPGAHACRFTDPASKREIGAGGPTSIDPIVRLDTNIADRVL
jgi:TonB family protein